MGGIPGHLRKGWTKSKTQKEIEIGQRIEIRRIVTKAEVPGVRMCT